MPTEVTYTNEDLRQMQSMSLEDKENRTLALISSWYAHWQNQCYVSFIGGKDSTVLADIAAQWCKIAGIPLTLCFVDTGLEFPEIKEHVREYADWLRDKHKIDVILDTVRPKMVFSEVIRKFGYPIISKGVSQKVYGARKGWGWDLKFFDPNDDKYGTGSMYNLCK